MTWTPTRFALPDAGKPVLVCWTDSLRVAMSRRDSANFWKDLEDPSGQAFRKPDWWCYVPDHPHAGRVESEAESKERAEFERLRRKFEGG